MSEAPYAENADYQAQAQGQPAAAELSDVPVRVSGTVQTADQAALHGAMFTVTIPASAAGAPSVKQLLPQDAQRKTAYVMPLDAPVIIGNSREQVTDPGNIGGSYPQGGYLNGWSPPIRHREPVWACNTSTSVACRVSVMVDTGGA